MVDKDFPGGRTHIPKSTVAFKRPMSNPGLRASEELSVER